MKLDKENNGWKYVNSKDIASLGLTSGVRKVKFDLRRNQNFELVWCQRANHAFEF